MKRVIVMVVLVVLGLRPVDYPGVAVAKPMVMDGLIVEHALPGSHELVHWQRDVAIDLSRARCLLSFLDND